MTLRLDLWQLYNHVALPLLPIVQQLGLQGIPFDSKRRDGLVIDLKGQLEKLTWELTGFGLSNPSSAQALSRDLVALGVPLTKRTEGGEQFSTDLDVLGRLHHDYNMVMENTGNKPYFPFLPPLMKYKRLEKARANLESLVACKDGKVRTALRSTGTQTGRYSSARLRWCNKCLEPGHGTNLQNIPKNSEELGVDVRSCFVAPHGWEFWELDFSQLELRIMAYVAGVSRLMADLESGANIHKDNALYLFDGRYNDALRTLAKNFLYALQYGGSVGAVQMALAKKGEYLSQAYIGELMLKIQARYPEMKEWQDRTTARLAAAYSVREPRIARNVFGRCRVLLGKDPTKEALSTQIQGTAAEVMNFVLLRLSAECRSTLVIQIHDSLIGCSPSGLVQRDMDRVREEMERPVWLKNDLGEPLFLKLGTDGKRGRVWAEMEKVAA